MSQVVLYMSMSLDGFVAGPDDGPADPLGRGGQGLHAWLARGSGDPRSHRPSGPSARVFDEMMATGAVIVGRRTFDLARQWNGDHHDGVPIFVLTHHLPDHLPRGAASVIYVTDGIESAVAQATEAAGDKDILVHGAETAQHCLRAGLLDEMQIHLIPVLLGEGRRLFDRLGAQHIELNLIRTVDAPGVQHLRYRVMRVGPRPRGRSTDLASPSLSGLTPITMSTKDMQPTRRESRS